MPQPERPQAEVLDFLGLMANVDPIDIPSGGAEVQVNAAALVTGELRCRLGLKEVIFEG